MCGIAGLINFNKTKIDNSLLNSINSIMIHRGPDDSGIYSSENVGLSMRRLAIIDLETGAQPICNEKGDIQCVCNGEIYNYKELRTDLLSRGHLFKSNSDAEVIIHLYEEMGPSLVNKLNGMFSFAIHDESKNLTLIARDRLGIKPLYYSVINDTFVFGSDLRIFNKFNVKINKNGIYSYLGLGYVPSPSTIYDNINKLTPGHYIEIKNNEYSLTKYWSIKNNITNNNQSLVINEMRSLLCDSINLQFRSDVPVGILLSGGIDSSALVALASECGFSNLNTFTINYSGKQGLDAECSRIISRKYNTNHTEINMDENSFHDNLEELINLIDEPVSDTAIVSTYLISKIARENGIKVLLSGAGGDEIFAGYRRHNKPKFGSPAWLTDIAPECITNIIGKFWSKFDYQRGMRYRSSVLSFALDCSGANMFLYNKIFNKKTNHEIISEMNGIYEPYFRNIRSQDYSYSRMKIDIHNYLLDNILSLTDKATMGASIEGRVPLLDHNLIELAFSIPSEINRLNAMPKGLFIEILKGKIPLRILNRRKEGFNAPTSKWRGTITRNKILNEFNLSPSKYLSEIINIDELNKVLESNVLWEKSANSLIGIYMLNKWLNLNIK